MSRVVVFVVGLALGMLALSAAYGGNGAPGGFTIRISLVDFFMIQRGLMALPDEHAKETLESVRMQVGQHTDVETAP